MQTTDGTARTYIPQAGTIPHRAIAMLKSLPAGHKLSTSEFADMLGQNMNGFSSCLGLARDAGLLASERSDVHPRVMYWSLGNGVPLDIPQRPADVPLANWKKLERAPKAKKPKPATPAPAPAPAAPAVKKVLSPLQHDPEPARKIEQAPANEVFRVGRFSDGTMTIQQGNFIMELTMREAVVLREVFAT